MAWFMWLLLALTCRLTSSEDTPGSECQIAILSLSSEEGDKIYCDADKWCGIRARGLTTVLLTIAYRRVVEAGCTQSMGSYFKILVTRLAEKGISTINILVLTGSEELLR